MPSKNPKHKTPWIEPSPELGVDIPEVRFYKDPALSEPHDFNFQLVDRGGAAEMPFYMQNRSQKTIYDIHLSIKTKPDADWPKKKDSVGPMHAQLEPEPPAKLPAGHVYAGKFVWTLSPDEPLGKRGASVEMTARTSQGQQIIIRADI